MSRHTFYKVDYDNFRDDRVDINRLSVGYCNGPQCMHCGAKACYRCYPEIMTEECVVAAR